MGMSLNNHLSLIRTVHSAFNTLRIKEKKRNLFFSALTRPALNQNQLGFYLNHLIILKLYQIVFLVNKRA